MTLDSTVQDRASTRRQLQTPWGVYTYYSLEAASGGAARLASLPYSIRVLLESALRNCDGHLISWADVQRIAQWEIQSKGENEIPFLPARVILQDFTGVPLLVDLAAMRAQVKRMGGDPQGINPAVTVDLVIDHSIQVDAYGTADSLLKNNRFEFVRNRERYDFLKWGQVNVNNFNVVPPSTGIVHQVNLEYLAQVITEKKDPLDPSALVLFPDSVVGTDSHTTMINGLGVLGWGVGGIEAEAVMLGRPMSMLLPKVVGVQLLGKLAPGVTATDLTLAITQRLRAHGVVDKFVEFYGAGIKGLSLADRATIANMAPEYGATCGFFPVDSVTLDYMRLTGRSEKILDLCKTYYRAQGLWYHSESPPPVFSEKIDIVLDEVVPSIAGPKRPQDRVPIAEVPTAFANALIAPVKQRGFALTPEQVHASGNGLLHGAVVIAAITSCTNTSNPSVMLAAGLLAKKAVLAGLEMPRYVKTSLAPGSKVVTAYLDKTGLLPYLEKLGFFIVGYGCTTCIGNSGPIDEEVEEAITKNQLVVCSVLSGNRNFEGRIHPAVRANYLASPPLVIAYALAGTICKDLTQDALAYTANGRPIFLKDIWPTPEEIAAVEAAIAPEMYQQVYANIFQGNAQWNSITAVKQELYPFDPLSSYIQEAPFFLNLSAQTPPPPSIQKARVLCMLGDSVTTDHISPAGAISSTSPAGEYLSTLGIAKADFNSYGARRGNDRVMVRGTLANVRLKNLLMPGVEGGVTRHFPSQESLSIYDAAMRYQVEEVPLIIIAGKEYGSGSSRDWAAKGVVLLGVKAVLVESFERIHRSNLIGMGVLPLQFLQNQNPETLGLSGEEMFTVINPPQWLPGQLLTIEVDDGGQKRQIQVKSRLDSRVEVYDYLQGGILQAVLRRKFQATQTQ